MVPHISSIKWTEGDVLHQPLAGRSEAPWLLVLLHHQHINSHGLKYSLRTGVRTIFSWLFTHTTESLPKKTFGQQRLLRLETCHQAPHRGRLLLIWTSNLGACARSVKHWVPGSPGLSLRGSGVLGCTVRIRAGVCGVASVVAAAQTSPIL